VKKIPSLFQRNYETDRLCRNELVPGCEWINDPGVIATRKFDGTCCLIRNGRLFKRLEVKPGNKPPVGFEPAGEPDPETGKQQGWVSCHESRPEDRWHFTAFSPSMEDGTYELCGPKVQGNPEKNYVAKVGQDDALRHVLIPHGKYWLHAPRDFDGLRDYLSSQDIEGIVFYHPDGRMAKVKKKDFGLPRKPVLEVANA
jgi:hypothetical protein